MSSEFTVIAIVAAHNEADIVGQVVGDLIRQGVYVYFLDDSSTDDTVAQVTGFLGRGVLQIEHLSATLGNARPGRFEWERILHRKLEIASTLDADWLIHHDADEFRESPWRDVLLKDAIRRVDAFGYNAIDFALLDFWPVDTAPCAGDDVRDAFRYYTPAEPYDRLQIRCWKKTAGAVDLVALGGHEVRFEDRRVFPVRFILRHYPIRSQAHGQRKVFAERRLRFVEEERAKGWHLQYDGTSRDTSFVRRSTDLQIYDDERIRLDLILRHREVEALEEAAHTQQVAFDALRQDLTTRDGALREKEAELVRCSAELLVTTRELEAQRTENYRLRVVISDRDEELSRRDLEAKHQARRIDELYRSYSWRVTRPLRAAYELSGLARRHSGVEPASVADGQNIAWGDLARVTPISGVWGTDRGVPIDRHYISHFLGRYRDDIRGRVLEVKDAGYAAFFGADRLLDITVLDINASNPNASHVADLARADEIPGEQFDCFILTQTLHIIYDVRSAIRHACRLLRTGGILLCTVPAVSRVNYEDGGLDSGDYWRMTAACVRRLFREAFGEEGVTVETHGNVRTCAAFLYGLAAEELDPHVLAYDDPWFPLIHCIRATKQRQS